MKSKIKVNFLIAGIIIALIICIGAVFYKFSENLNWIDAFFSTSLLLTTAGSSYITQPLSKIFSIIFVLLGIPAVLFCLGYIIEEILKKKIDDLENKVNNILDTEEKIIKKEDKILENEAKADRKNYE